MWNKGWDNIFKTHDWGQYPPEDLIRFIAGNFKKSDARPEKRLLEVGCGTGANIWFLAREGFDVTGIDGSKNGIEKAKARLAKENLKAQFFVGDILKLPFNDACFDGVIDCECIYANSYKDSQLIMKEIYRVMKPGAVFYSKSFATGTYGDGNGEKLEGEKNTYTEILEGALRSDYGIIRFMDKEEIYDLYDLFEINSIDYLIRSSENSKFDIKEWIISCTKNVK